MSVQAFNNNNNKQACLNPLSDNTNNHSGMTHTERGLRAASHVSMEHTAQAHEYNPTCPCPDCQDILTNFTQYHILDAFTAEHLRYEASLQAAYGYVPAKGNCDYVVTSVCVGLDQATGEEIFEQRVEYTKTNMFHSHLYQMKPVPAEVRERSYQRFFENNNNNVAAAAPAIPAPRNRQQQNYVATHNHNNNNGNLARAFATHQNVHQKVNNNNNNNYNNARRYNNNYNNNQQQSFNTNNNYVSNNFQNYYAAAPQQQQQYNNSPFHYTRSDIDQAAQQVAFSGVATLGN